MSEKNKKKEKAEQKENDLSSCALCYWLLLFVLFCFVLHSQEVRDSGHTVDTFEAEVSSDEDQTK